MEVYLYLLVDATYPLHTCLMKRFNDRCDLDKVQFDNLMNGHVFIANVFWEFEELVVHFEEFRLHG
jgi:hypothetical protein